MSMQAFSASPPTVTILINNYNYGRFLKDAIDSALAQSYPDVEVVVVDDGSTDESRDIIASYGDEVLPVYKDNGGQGSAINAGFQVSCGDLIMLLDSDDYYTSDQAVGSVVGAWAPGVSQIHYRLLAVSDDGTVVGYHPPLDQQLCSGRAPRQKLLSRGNYVHPHTSGLCFSRQLLGELLPIPEEQWRNYADAYLAATAPFIGLVAAIQEPLGAWRVHGGNVSVPGGVHADSRVFRRLLEVNVMRETLLVQMAMKTGDAVSPSVLDYDNGILQRRLVLLRLEGHGADPFPGDRRLPLLYRGLISSWRYSGFSLAKRVIHCLWFLLVALAPRRPASAVIRWMYVPSSRPRILEKARRMLRAPAGRVSVKRSSAIRALPAGHNAI